MPSVNFYLKIKNIKQLEDVFDKLDVKNNQIRWKNKWRNDIAPLTQEELAKWLGIENASSDKWVCEVTSKYLIDHNYKEFSSSNWTESDYHIGDIVYNKKFAEELIKCQSDPEFKLKKEIILSLNTANNGVSLSNIVIEHPTPTLETLSPDEIWIGVLGRTTHLPFSLISKLCVEEDITFLCRFEENILSKIDKSGIFFVDLDIEKIQTHGIVEEFLNPQMLLDIEKQELALANILNDKQVIGVEKEMEQINEMQNSHDLIERIVERINDKISLFTQDANDFKQTCNAYFLHKRLKIDLMKNKSGMENVEHEEKKTKI